MRSRTLVAALALLCWRLCHALTVPARVSGLSLSTSPFNTTDPFSLRTVRTANIPNEFLCSTEFLRRGYRPMNEIAFYINALLVMHDLALLPQQSALPEWKTWELPDYGVRIAAKTMEIRYAVWGLWLGVHRGPSAGFWPMVLKLRWSEIAVGQIVVAPRQIRSTNIIDGGSFPASNTWAPLPTLAFNATVSGAENSLNSLGAPHFQYNITPNGRQITVKHLFLTTFEALVTSAEWGPTTSFPGLTFDGFMFVPIFDSRMESLMCYGDLIEAMMYATTTAVSNHYFNEVDIEVLKDGVKIGSGQLRNPRGVESE